MAATTIRRPAPSSRTGPAWLRSYREEGGSASAALLGAALVVAVLYAAFASGSIGIPEESRLQIGVALIALGALAALVFARGLRASPAPLAVVGLALLAGFALWSGLSTAWSVSPDESWLEFNRAITYALMAALGLVLGGFLQVPGWLRPFAEFWWTRLPFA